MAKAVAAASSALLAATSVMTNIWAWDRSQAAMGTENLTTVVKDSERSSYCQDNTEDETI